MKTRFTKAQLETVDEIQIQLQKRIDSIIEDAKPFTKSIFRNLANASPQNAQILCDFTFFERAEQNFKQNTIINHIHVLIYFNKSLGYKSFERIAKEDTLGYLLSLKKPETVDPTHKSIGTYNARQMILSKFFRWLSNKNETDQKKWITPPCMQGVKALTREENSPYNSSDMWSSEEHAIFLKYCTSKRDRCYHAMAYDTSARPKELLSLKIKDIEFELSSTGIQYAQVHIKISKTKPRTLPLIFSVPYIKDWIDDHPQNGNPNAYLFISLSNKNNGQKLGGNGLYQRYDKMRGYFSKLIEDQSIPERDKAFIKNMLTKPWNPYIFRHSGLTDKSEILKESTLRSYAGWSPNSKMPNVYIHYFGNESSKSLLEHYGVESYQQKKIDSLKGITCPNCSESNKNEARYCRKCRMVLTYSSYIETIEENQVKEKEMTDLKAQMATILESQKEFQQLLKDPSRIKAVLEKE